MESISEVMTVLYRWLTQENNSKNAKSEVQDLVVPLSRSLLSQNTDEWKEGLTESAWRSLIQRGNAAKDEIEGRVYLGGVESSIRNEVWPYLLGHYELGNNRSNELQDIKTQQKYERTKYEWSELVSRLEIEDLPGTGNNLSTSLENYNTIGTLHGNESTLSILPENENILGILPGNRSILNPLPGNWSTPGILPENRSTYNTFPTLEDEDLPDSHANSLISNTFRRIKTCVCCHDYGLLENLVSSVSASYDDATENEEEEGSERDNFVEGPAEVSWHRRDQASSSTCEEALRVDDLREKSLTGNSVASFPTLNLKREITADLIKSFEETAKIIKEDVLRCDRYLVHYFSDENNLEKLRNVVTTYVWEHLDIGYRQGMCDMASPLLYVLEDEAMTYACFCRLMDRMEGRLSNKDALIPYYEKLRYLIQIFDRTLFDLMSRDQDCAAFSYRWFLLDFKREFSYEDVLTVWEMIWAARSVSSAHFGIFIALALILPHSEKILREKMEFSDFLLFFNGLAEQHDAQEVLKRARNFVFRLQTILD